MVLRVSRPTNRAAAAWKLFGQGGFAPISTRPVLAVAPLRPAPVRSISIQIRLCRMVPPEPEWLLSEWLSFVFMSQGIMNSIQVFELSMFFTLNRYTLQRNML
ncbi:MAG: hypothetical protein AB7U75_11705 [Hyphomicrobiaceae bacterium]